MNFVRNLFKEIVSIVTIVVMVAITIITFEDYNTTDAVACLIATIMTVVLYIIITLIQSSTKLYNHPYKIPKENVFHANNLMFNYIVCVKLLSILLLALFEIAIYLGFNIIIYISFFCYCIILLMLTIKCLYKLKCLR